MSRLKILALLPLAVALSGCNYVVLTPAGDIAAQQRDLVIISTVLMLLIIVPVMALTRAVRLALPPVQHVGAAMSRIGTTRPSSSW